MTALTKVSKGNLERKKTWPYPHTRPYTHTNIKEHHSLNFLKEILNKKKTWPYTHTTYTHTLKKHHSPKVLKEILNEKKHSHTHTQIHTL